MDYTVSTEPNQAERSAQHAELKTNLARMLKHLHRGGGFGYWWTLRDKKSTWWPVAKPATLPALEDVYFGIHPVSAIPTTDDQGNERPPKYLRSRADLITAVNCLYAEFDDKDFDQDASKTLAYVRSLQFQPSILIRSGGGYHAYWLLKDTFTVQDESNRAYIDNLQKRWVDAVGSDDGAKDLARILRVPGTLNAKYDPQRPVTFLEADFDRLYTLSDLEAILPDPDPQPTEEKRPERRGNGEGGRPGDEWAKVTTWDDLLTSRGWKHCRQRGNVSQWTRPGKDGGVSATTGYAGTDMIYNFSSSVPYLEPEKGYSKFGFYAAADHGGDYKAAAKALAALGFGEQSNNGHQPTMPEEMPIEFYVELWEQLDAEINAQAESEQILDLSQNAPATLSEPVNRPELLQAEPDHDGHALCVTVLYPDRISYSEALGWMFYDGRCWQRDDAEAQVDLYVVNTLKARRQAAVKADKEGLVKITRANSNNLNGTKALLRSRVTVSPNEFDQDPDLLNCRNGVLNLRTGELMAHNPRRRFTYTLPVDYDPAADYSEWVNFLFQAVNYDQETLDYLQMAIGYSLTGDTREEVLFYLYGPTRSGKGTFTETLLSVLGRPLATEADFSSFTADRYGDTQNFDLAPLKPCRIVAASESNKNRPLNPAKIKAMTGGNEIRCAYKHRDHFNYRPQFKIWLSSNHPANVDVDDDAAWARVKVIEFPNSHLGNEDKTLKVHLRQPAQLRGVLRWAVEGARRWYQNPQGLRTPPAVHKATQAQRTAQDFIQMFLDENTEADPAGWIHIGALHGAYKNWCEANGIPAKYLNQFSQAVAGKGYQQERRYNDERKQIRVITGLKMRGQL